MWLFGGGSQRLFDAPRYRRHLPAQFPKLSVVIIE